MSRNLYDLDLYHRFKTISMMKIAEKHNPYQS